MSVMSVHRVMCPHCEAVTTIQKTRQLSNVCREITCHCTNEFCGCVFVASITPVRVLSPSAIPDPTVFIPLSKHIDRDRMQSDLFKAVPRA